MAAPWFKKWAGDYLSDSKILILSWEQRGIIEALWCHACKDGSIPADYDVLARLLPGLSAKSIKKLASWVPQFFIPDPSDPSRLVSPRMQAEEAEYRAMIDRRKGSASKAGKASAAKRAMHETGNDSPTYVEDTLGIPFNGRSTDVQRNPTESESESEKDIPPTPFGVGSPEAGVGGVPRKPKRRTRAEVLLPFPPAVRAWVNRVAGSWPTEDTRDGRAVRMDPEVLAENVQAILADQPGLTLDLLEEAAGNYLASAPQRWKAPQFFFGPGKAPDGPPWRPWTRALLPDENHFPVSA